MENSIIFYHFSTKDFMDSSGVSESSISFCQETKTVFTGGIEYLSFNWSEIPNINKPTVSNGKLIMNQDSALIEGDLCVFSDPTYSINESTLIIP